MNLTFLRSIDSTQNYLKDLLKSNDLELPHAVVADRQTCGVGSRGNAWQSMEGNLFLSFALPLKELPEDLKIESSSIYFAYLLKETLSELHSTLWLKWPNDFYINNFKIGGMITNVMKENIICGVGLNLVVAPEGFGTLDIEISREELLEKYFTKIQTHPTWKQVFSKYQLEYSMSKKFFTHNNNSKILLKDASLQSDGSLISNGERIFSLR